MSTDRDVLGESVAPNIAFGRITPILRIFDIGKADEFYVGFLGFTVDWNHRFDDVGPLYRQISRGDLILHLSEHHGDGCPGACLRVAMRGVAAFHQELLATGYRYMRPGVERMPWGTQEIEVIDPFSNHIRFFEPVEST